MLQHHRRSARHGFSTAEAVVVICIVVIAAVLAMPLLNGRPGPSRVRAQSQVNSLATACESYLIQFRDAPGYLPETYWSTYSPANFTAHESAVLSLMGGIVTSGGTPIPGGNFGNFDPNMIGVGPTVGGKIYGAFYSPRASELLATTGTVGANAMPEFVEPTTGVPLLFFRANKGASGKRTVDDTTLTPPEGHFCRASNQNYLESKFGRYDQSVDSLLSSKVSPASVVNNNLAWALIDSAISSVTATNNGSNDGVGDIRRGSYIWYSPGGDGIYMEKSHSKAVESSKDLDRFDDVSASGGP